jgi:signal transduction histidine kinase
MIRETPANYKSGLCPHGVRYSPHSPHSLTAKETGDADQCKLLHELQVCKIELEAQNKALLQAQAQSLAVVEHYKRLYDFAPVGYFTLGKNGRVEDLNLTGANLLGVERDRLIGQALASCFTTDFLFYSHLREACSTGLNVVTELQIKRPDAPLLDVQLESRIVDDGVIHTIMTNISERKRFERELQQQHTDMDILLRQQVAAQTALAIAHEINQPLAAVSLYGEVAMRYLEGGTVTVDRERLQQALTGCVEQSRRAGSSLHRLLEFMQKDGREAELIDVNRLVEETLTLVQNSGYGGFQSRLELEQPLPHGRGNRLKVQKVLVNLLQNGIDAMRGAGLAAAAITLTVRSLRVRNKIQVTVQDSGNGLDIETAKNIFEPFFTTKPNSMGLSLAISRTFIEANGGELWVDPPTGSGATFHFTLPLAQYCV